VSLVNMEAFWLHSISCGASAKLFAKQMKLPQPESYFVAGLLHDIARLLIYTQLPTHALYLLTEAKRQQRPMHELEEETLGFTHEQLGSELMHVWNCPQELAQRILRHHQPVNESSCVEYTVLPAANMLSLALGYGSSGEHHICPISPVTWNKLETTPENILTHCQNLDDDVRGLRAMFATASK
jgi:HD-like signal output (HDOD) protein